MTWWHYLLLANLYLVVFFSFYMIFLRKETFFQLNRVYLVGAALLSFFIPLIQSDWIRNLFITQRVQQTIYNLPVVEYQFNAAPQDNQYTIGQILAIVYLAGIVILSVKLAWQLFTLKRVINQPEATAAYSFFNKIKVEEDTGDREIIVAHELAHARQWHSADILLIEAIMIINWFNPVVYFYRKAIKHIHEFIADQDALKAGTNKAEYAMLLLSQTFITPPHSLVTPFFNHSLLKQRIMMLHKNKSQRIKLIKYGLSAPLFALMLILSSATINNSKTITTIHDKAEQVFLIPAGGESASEISADLLKDNQVSPPAKPARDTAKKNDVFTAVDSPPTFPGGIDGFYKYLASNLRYPQEARNQNIQGKVFLQYVIEIDGRLSDIKVVRGIGGGCDEEAIRVLKGSPRWVAGSQNGKKVRVQYVLPITFSTNKMSDVPEVKLKGNGLTTGVLVSKNGDGVYTSLEQPATFPGGMESFYGYLQHNLKYPTAAREKNVQGKVFVQYIIETDGSLIDLKIVRGIGSGCDEEAIRVMKGSPKWIPGMQGGKAVRSMYTLPISFTLSDPKKLPAKDTVLKKADLIFIRKGESPERTYSLSHHVAFFAISDTSKRVGQVFVNKGGVPGQNPLYIIDGKEGDLPTLPQIPPGEIESIRVYRGPDATTTYGPKAIFGVIVVATKHKYSPPADTK